MPSEGSRDGRLTSRRHAQRTCPTFTTLRTDRLPRNGTTRCCRRPPSVAGRCCMTRSRHANHLTSARRRCFAAPRLSGGLCTASPGSPSSTRYPNPFPPTPAGSSTTPSTRSSPGGRHSHNADEALQARGASRHVRTPVALSRSARLSADPVAPVRRPAAARRLRTGSMSGQTRSRCPAGGSPRGCPPWLSGVALFRSAVRRAP